MTTRNWLCATAERLIIFFRLETVQLLVSTYPELIVPLRNSSSSVIFPHTPLHLASRNGHRWVKRVIGKFLYYLRILCPFSVSLDPQQFLLILNRYQRILSSLSYYIVVLSFSTRTLIVLCICVYKWIRILSSDIGSKKRGEEIYFVYFLNWLNILW